MTACSYGMGHYQCRKRGWLLGKCLTHRADATRGEWKIGSFRIRLDLGRLALPSYTVDDDFEPPMWRSFDFGVDGCDPAFGITWERQEQASGENEP